MRLANLHSFAHGGFLLEAKAFGEQTCIAGGLFLMPIQRKIPKVITTFGTIIQFDFR